VHATELIAVSGNGIDNVGTGFGLHQNMGSQPCHDSLGFTQLEEFDFS
jgi:hypothetical protein